MESIVSTKVTSAFKVNLNTTQSTTTRASSTDSFSQVLKNRQSENDDRTTSSVKESTNDSNATSNEVTDATSTVESKTQTKTDKSQTDETGEADAIDDNKDQSKEEEALEKIADQLNMTQEELAQVMANLNLTLQDLKQPENLQALISTAMGIDQASDLLVDGESFAQYKEIYQSIETILSDVVDEGATQALQISQTTTQAATHEVKTTQEPGQTQASSPSATETDSIIDEGTEISVEDLRNIALDEKASENQQEPSSGDNNSKFSNLLNNLNDAINKKIEGSQELENTNFQSKLVDAKSVMDQLVKAAKVTLTDETQTMSMQLEPENLGKIALAVSSEKGTLSGKLIAENTSVKEALEVNLINLKASLNEQGIKVEKLEVVVGNTNQFTDMNNQSQGRDSGSQTRKRRYNIADTIESIDAKIQSLKDGLNLNDTDVADSSINYTA